MEIRKRKSKAFLKAYDLRLFYTSKLDQAFFDAEARGYHCLHVAHFFIDMRDKVTLVCRILGNQMDVLDGLPPKHPELMTEEENS